MKSPKKYYREDLNKLYNSLTPKNAKAIKIKKENYKAKGRYEYVIVDDVIGDLNDVQAFFSKIKNLCNERGKIVVTYYNHLWEYPLRLASKVGLRQKIEIEQNWLDAQDITNLLDLSGFEVVTKQKRFLFPFDIPILSTLINGWVAHLPLINSLCLTTYVIARKRPSKKREYSVSVIVPARNEEGNVPKIAKSIPKFGKSQEIIFVEGHSKDKTWEAIQKEIEKKHRKSFSVKGFQQEGEGKFDAVKLGFEKASGDVLMIYDADRTVNPKDLKKFYDAISKNRGEFANGSRLVYPMEKRAMGVPSKLANQFFSWIFTWILGQRFKDTLCGTKALFKKDYEKIKRTGEYFNENDPFGDYALIFGAISHNLKVVEIPVRYKERSYGSTNINRFKDGLVLARMSWEAFKKFKVLDSTMS